MDMKVIAVRGIADILDSEGLFGFNSYSKDIKENFINYICRNNFQSEWSERGINIRVGINLGDTPGVVDIENISVGAEICGWDKVKIRNVTENINNLLNITSLA